MISKDPSTDSKPVYLNNIQTNNVCSNTSNIHTPFMIFTEENKASLKLLMHTLSL